MICKNCNTEIGENQMFCSKCGSPAISESTIEEVKTEENQSEIPQGIPQSGGQTYQSSSPVNNNMGVPQGNGYSGGNNSASGTNAQSFFLKLWGYYKELWLNYVNFDGRVSIEKFWLTILANFLVTIALEIVLKIVPIPYLSSLYSIATFIPLLGLDVRRLHDVGKNWTYLFMSLIPIVGPIIVIIALCQKGDINANQYGSVPQD